MAGNHSLKIPSWLIIPIIFIGVVVLFFPFRYVFEFDPDEGVELIKSLLIADDFNYLKLIPSDHPPLYTIVLASIFSSLGPNVLWARLVTLFFSMLFLCSMSCLISKNFSPLHAGAAAIMVVLTPYYFQLSTSVMRGFVSITLAALSIAFIIGWHAKEKPVFLGASGLFFGLSLSTKLFTIFLIPIFMIGITAKSVVLPLSTTPKSKILKDWITWGTPCLAILVISFVLLSSPENAVRNLQIPFNAQTTSAYLDRAVVQDINYYLRDSLGFIPLGILSLFAINKRTFWPIFYLFLWVVGAYISLLILVPVWYHHQQLVTLPLGLLAGIGVVESFQRFTARRDNLLSLNHRSFIWLPMAILSLVVFSYRIVSVSNNLHFNLPNIYPGSAFESEEYEVLAVMYDRSDQASPIVTDRPMFAFRMNRPVPPELVVISEKRLFTGEISQGDIRNAINREQPDLILFGRFSFPSISRYLQGEYDTAYNSSNYQLYIHKDLAKFQ
jgi:4-amino-4-deoxy-L-arabinose transferase-like glycosyltransferase